MPVTDSAEPRLALLADGPFRGGTYVVTDGERLTFPASWFNVAVAYEMTGETGQTDEGEVLLMRVAGLTLLPAPAAPEPVPALARADVLRTA